MLNLKNIKSTERPQGYTSSIVVPDRNFVRQIVVSPGFNFYEYACDNVRQLSDWLLNNGALLIRNAEFTTDEFAALCDLFGPVTKHSELSSPRTQLSNGVYTSTDHPANQIIQMHNEQSYLSYWPMVASFMCEIAAREGGCTPIADCRNFDVDLPLTMVEKLKRHGVTYVRNFGPESSIRWRDSYDVESQQELEEYCDARGMRVVWNGAEQPTVYSDLPAFRPHIDTGVECFFNNIVVASPHALPERESSMLSSIYGDEMKFPINVTYGDGSRITAEDIRTILDAYERRTFTFDWNAKDVVIVDNMMTSHGRQAYVGPRKIVVRVNRIHDSRG